MQKSIIESVIDQLSSKGFDAKYIEKIENGIRRNGISIVEKNRSNSESIIAPIFYIDEMICHGKDADQISNELLSLYKSQIKEVRHSDMNKIATLCQDWDYVKNNLQLCIQRQSDEFILKRKFLDLEMYIRIIFTSGEETIASAKIKPQMLQYFGVSEDDLFKLAYEQTKKHIEVINIKDILQETMDNRRNTNSFPFYIPPDALNEADDKMFVMRTGLNYGASALCFLDSLNDFARKHNSDLIIIPASINEIILLMHEDIRLISKYEEICINWMIKDVNVNECHPCEVLMDHPYFYDRKTKQIYMDLSSF